MKVPGPLASAASGYVRPISSSYVGGAEGEGRSLGTDRLASTEGGAACVFASSDVAPSWCCPETATARPSVSAAAQAPARSRPLCPPRPAP
ncbi:hypothetical protein GA0115252_16489, partial [Streptomyces sp. DfronAA-171]